jgi:DNA invertase Pin-like site-specific DNA recombinase
MGDARAAIGYVRVSTDEQALGHRAQAAALDAWAEREGVQLVAVFVDLGVSGSTDPHERAGLTAALAAARDLRAGVLVAHKRDRLGRGEGIAPMVERMARQHGAIVRTTDGASDATGIAGVMQRMAGDLVGAVERELIRERTRNALQIKRSRGEVVGVPPFGYRDDGEGHLVTCTIEQHITGHVRALRSSGLSTRAIAGKLEAEGVCSPRSGRPLRQTQIVRILSREVTT